METNSAQLNLSYAKRRGPIPKELGHYVISPTKQWKYKDGWAYEIGDAYRVSVKVGPRRYRVTIYQAKLGEEVILQKIRNFIQSVRVDLGMTPRKIYVDLPLSLT